MTQVNMGDEVIETDLPAEAVADLQQPEADPTPAPQEPEKQPEPTVEPAPAVADPVPERPKKAGPIADLLEKKHELEKQLETERQAKADLEARLASLSTQAPSAQVDDKISALAEKHGIDPEILADIVATARDGLNPGLPPEVQELIAGLKAEKQQKEELAIFNKRVDSLASTLKDDLLKDQSVREKLQALAYSTEKAPDGEPYYQKELAEIYFGFVKPEVEPGKVSAEAPRGGKSGQELLDFEDILGDESKMDEFARTAPKEQWQAFTKWRDEKQGDSKIIRRSN